jgi:hypothetical protein
MGSDAHYCCVSPLMRTRAAKHAYHGTGRSYIGVRAEGG